MSQPINDGGPAFPTATLAQKTEGGITLPYQPTPYYPIVSVTTTKTLRDEFAMAALQGLLASCPWEQVDEVPQKAYEISDAMLKARGGEMNHLGDTNKMVSDTPRTDAAYFKKGATMYDLAGEMKLLERELNAAQQRIKRLEEALTWYESKVSDCNRRGPEGDAARDALAKDLGHKAKEAKP